MKTKIFSTLAFCSLVLLFLSGSQKPVEAAKTAPEIISMAKPSIVRILYEIHPEDDVLLQFYQVRQKPKESIRALSGSGFVISVDHKGAYILTNYHVVRPLGYDPNVFVRIPGEGDYRIISRKLDRERNLAILLIEKFDLKPLVLGESVIGAALKEGQDLLAIGYPFAAKISDTTDKEPSATKGIISAFKQTAQEATFIQTDASINEGNSGGPAFNMQGHVIGVVFAGAGKNNNYKATYKFIFGGGDDGPPINISFVVPIDHAKHMLTAANVGWLKPEAVLTTPVPNDKEPAKKDWRDLFSSPKFYLPVGGLIVMGVIAAFYMESAKRKKIAPVSGPSPSRQTPTQGEQRVGAASPRTTAYAFGGLKCTGGELSGKTFTVSEKGVNIGRGPGNEIQLSSDVVSRRHAWIGPVAGEIVIKDLGSTNGTFVNNEQVTESKRLRSGDTIRITKNGQDIFVFTA